MGGGGGHMGGGGNPHHNRGPRPPHRNQTFDSNGPNVKIRGNAYQVFERYLAMAREAQSSGDPVAAENFYQHAEHYYRVMQAAGEGQQQNQQQGQQRPMTPADTEMGAGETGAGESIGNNGGGRDGEQRYGENRDGEQRYGENRDGQDQREHQNQNHQHHQGSGEAQVQVHTPPQPQLPADPGDEQPPYRDDQPPGF